MRVGRNVLISIGAAAIFAALSISKVCSIQAGEAGVRVTVDEPTTVSVSETKGPASTPAGATRLVVTVTGFEPSSSGPVAAVVTTRCGDNIKEIGRFGIFPNAAFTASGNIKPQRFGIELPDEPVCHIPREVTIRLEPSIGDGRGASLTIENLSLE